MELHELPCGGEGGVPGQGSSLSRCLFLLLFLLSSTKSSSSREEDFKIREASFHKI